ncbi:hypothetical protein BO86DRAFT_26739 [Aspergillus japonicus CBS 114.51]|uniref:Uncharacterized protein n=2 Tax=Aspergillus TaxID=5052 RepID=A0A2V5HXW2_ASPV1|nr:hypothetical protein BO86DRAFT_26739 [Aspergillus japonicus CBS 114.51]PYI16707.1 hypothetical protein BO99DRAFT_212616 [Aspergillus violaceofuscus CBS 115571]RAH84033.1 hypothetical protein BO86DRAFT_26739 [Aspergillus japonicus CBS 114.51]
MVGPLNLLGPIPGRLDRERGCLSSCISCSLTAGHSPSPLSLFRSFALSENTRPIERDVMFWLWRNKPFQLNRVDIEYQRWSVRFSLTGNSLPSPLIDCLQLCPMRLAYLGGPPICPLGFRLHSIIPSLLFSFPFHFPSPSLPFPSHLFSSCFLAHPSAPPARSCYHPSVLFPLWLH